MLVLQRSSCARGSSRCSRTIAQPSSSSTSSKLAPSRAHRQKLQAASEMYGDSDDLFVVTGGEIVDIADMRLDLEGVSKGAGAAKAFDVVKIIWDSVPVYYTPSASVTTSSSPLATSTPPDFRTVTQHQLVKRFDILSRGSAEAAELYLMELYGIKPNVGCVYAVYPDTDGKTDTYSTLKTAPNWGLLVRETKAFRVYDNKLGQL